jgi:hypothetical protein
MARSVEAIKAAREKWRARKKERAGKVRFWNVRLKRAQKRLVALREELEQAQRTAPPIVTAENIGLSFVNKFGQLGPEKFVTGHHTAGPKDTSVADAIRLDKQYHAQHAGQGWGGIGYHFNVARDGTLICLRPTILKGAHVGGWNSNNVGVMFHGTTGDRPTDAQRATYKWLLASAHTLAMPAAHRTDLDLRKATRRGHNDWPGHGSNACPGTHKPMILAGG